jgi:hypothetical protein
MKCEAGPVKKSFGKVDWLVYGCDDGRSLVVVSAPGSPAMPFYFLVAVADSGINLRGEGTGDKAATDATYKELSALTVTEVAALYSQAKSIGGRK